MKFGYAIIYVPEVVKTIEFYEKAFGLKRKFVHESKTYAELDTGNTTLAFAYLEASEADELGIRANLKTDSTSGFDVCFLSDDVSAAFHFAVESGATAVSSPTLKPWGQTVAFLRDLNGCLVEIASPISS